MLCNTMGMHGGTGSSDTACFAQGSTPFNSVPSVAWEHIDRGVLYVHGRGNEGDQQCFVGISECRRLAAEHGNAKL